MTDPSEKVAKEFLHDRYQLQARLDGKERGRKAGRQTWLAIDRQSQKQVVVKLLSFNQDFQWDDLKLFEREAETLRDLSHPAIPSYIDCFQVDTGNRKGFALVQSYLPAQSLEAWRREGKRFHETQLKQLARELLNILIYLHQRHPPVIHRDIKPSNVLMTTPKSSIGSVYLVDFGSVQTLANREGKTMTVVGTYGYMPPEQFGDRAVPASDLYSLGATLIALATGMEPADLPHRDLKIDFAQFTHLSSSFVRWLQWLTDPVLEQRPANAKVALEGLDDARIVVSYTAHLFQTPVTPLELLWRAVWTSTGLGITMGGAYGSLYGTILWPGVGTLVSAIVGGSVGAPLGLFNGLLMAFLTHSFYFPLKNPRQYRKVMTLTSTAVCTAAGLVGIAVAVGKLFGSSAYPIYLLSTPIGFTASVIAGLTMGAIARHYARWYERRSKPDQP
ncbi:MAG: serine/threonine-protein kinase [Leptolyngbyaceae cyanobacterium bins.59]|nr:serine/threonine-protein kinase [Leptolyngbyaceae cyanobacterium bins.59]